MVDETARSTPPIAATHPMAGRDDLQSAELGPLSDRAQRWASTMGGFPSATPGVRVAHANGEAHVGDYTMFDRLSREEAEQELLAPGATHSSGAGSRHREEEPDDLRTCFERDRDRILHSRAFRRLAGKTQVFIFPDDHQRTRLTHALEVAQVATGIASACRLNVALTEAIALGHDCGHGPGGHASEDALSPFLPEEFNHAVWGADVALTSLNLCVETLDGIRNHSWSRPSPSTPEGQVVGIADRLAYSAHDLEDAVSAGIISLDDLPKIVTERCGHTRSKQLRAFIGDVVQTTTRTEIVSISEQMAEALAALRRFNYENIYLRPTSIEQGRSVITLLSALVEHYANHPKDLPENDGIIAGDHATVRRAVTYVAGMTDKFACLQATTLLDWPADQLPRGLGVAG